MKKWIILITISLMTGCCSTEIVRKECPEPEPCPELDCPECPKCPNIVPKEIRDTVTMPCPDFVQYGDSGEYRIGVIDMNILVEKAPGRIHDLIVQFDSSAEALEYMELGKNGNNPKREQELKELLQNKLAELYRQFYNLAAGSLKTIDNLSDKVVTKCGVELYTKKPKDYVQGILLQRGSYVIVDITQDVIDQLNK